MSVMDRLGALLPDEAARLLKAHAGEVTQIRLRAGRPVRLSFGNGRGAMTGTPLDGAALAGLLSALMEHSVYARQNDLDEGFFTLGDGSRVGVCGRMYPEGDRLRMGEIGSACVRVARPVPGCADALIDGIDAPEGLCPTLLVSPPGLGKTTLLRDIARQLSLRGRCVGIADERHELAACHRGVPTLDVGPCADVMDGCPRSEAIRRLVRTMAPEVIVADEIGGEGDALALADAVRCGVAVVASAHGNGLDELLSRPCLRAVLESGAIGKIALLGPRPGAVRALWRRTEGGGEKAWRRE